MTAWDPGGFAARTRSTALMYLTGAVLVLVSMLPSQPAEVNRSGIAAVAVAAGATAALAMLLGSRYTVGVSKAFSVAGSVMIGLIVAMAGPSYLSILYASLFVWVAQYAAVFFGWRAALGYVGFGALVHAIALQAGPAGGRLMTWSVTLGTALVVLCCYGLFDRMSARLRALVEHSGGVIAIVDRDFTIRSLRGAVQRVLGYGADELVNASLLSVVNPDEFRTVVGALSRAVHDRSGTALFEASVHRKDGSRLYAEISAENAVADPAVRGLVVTLRDVTERKELEDQLAHQAFHDSLTGLANRALFADRVEHALARRRHINHALAVLFIDLDDFKAVNDSLGHGAGDELLAAVAARLAAAARSGDTVARLGGDEFAVLAEDIADAEDVEALADRLHAALAAPVKLGDEEVFVGASIGASLSSPATQDPSELLRDADMAMYQAKQDAKGRFRQFDPTMHDELLHRLRLQTDLRHALDRGELRLQYQPTVDLTTRAVHGVEALLRWHHPQLGLVPPTEFIPVAESTGLVVTIGQWVLREACEQARQWHALQPDSPPISVHVNVSGRQLEHLDFVEQVDEVLAATGLPPHTLVLEITESVLLEDLDATIGRLQRLRRLGVKIAIDDFGTGYSSLGYINKLPVDVVKVDKSFMDSISTGTKPGLVHMIVQLCGVLGMDAVAEGVEQEVQAQALQQVACDYGQGYLFARPMDPEDIPGFLAAATSADFPGGKAGVPVPWQVAGSSAPRG